MKERFVEIETHLHSVPVSPCSALTVDEIVHFYKDKGYYGVFITDHFITASLDIPGLEHKSWEQKADYYLSGYRKAKRLGDAVGLKVFLGMEISPAGSKSDFLIFGLTEEWVYRWGPLYRGTLDEISKTVRGAGMLLFEAHPYRYGLEPQDPSYYDGIEIFNAHPRHESRNNRALKFARDHKLWVCSGSDAHCHEDMGRSGVMMPAVESEREFADYYASVGSPELIIVCDDK